MKRFVVIVNFVVIANLSAFGQSPEYDKAIDAALLKKRQCFSEVATVFDDQISDAATIARLAVHKCYSERVKFLEAVKAKVTGISYWSFTDDSSRAAALQSSREAEIDEALGAVLAVRVEGRKKSVAYPSK